MPASVCHPTYRLTFEARPLAAWEGLDTALRALRQRCKPKP